MKKFKLLSVLLILVTLFAMPTAYAHDIELETYGTIKIPFTENKEMGSNTKVEINSEFGAHVLLYQYVEINAEIYKAYEEILNEQRKYEKENKPASGAEQTVIDDFNKKIKEYEDNKQAILPEFNESNWITSKNDTVPLNTEGVTNDETLGFRPYVLWVALTYEANTNDRLYNNKVIIYKASPISTDNEEDEKNANTGDNVVLFVAAAVLIAGVMVVSYKKSRA